MGPVILPYRNILPRIDPSAFIAPGAIVIGDVEIGPRANIWFNCVIRGDDAPIRIGAGANIQDGTIVHVTFEAGEHIECVIGDEAAIGHMALLHACMVRHRRLLVSRCARAVIGGSPYSISRRSSTLDPYEIDDLRNDDVCGEELLGKHASFSTRALVVTLGRAERLGGFLLRRKRLEAERVG